MRPPPSTAKWMADSELRGGHSVEQVIAYLDWCDDWRAEVGERRSDPPYVISPQVEPKIVRLLRRWFGR
jgi:hypothetical protein